MLIRELSELPGRNPLPKPWIDVKANLPWGEIEFSKRMLKEHLDPSHDLATRRPIITNAQISWVMNKFLIPRKAKTILDLTCGPGIWANALAKNGFTVRGIDLSPAAIDYARKIAREENLPATYLQGDIRDTAFGSGYDAILFIYGEANALKWEEFSLILLRAMESLNQKGIIILELIPPEAMARMAGTSWQTNEGGGLFGESPYLQLTENFWHPDERTGATRHYIVDLVTTRVREYGISYQCYTPDDLNKLLPSCGLEIIAEYDSLLGEKSLPKPDWHVVIAERQK